MKYQMSFRAKTRYPPGSPALHHHPSPLKFPISFQVPRKQVRLLCGPNRSYFLWLMVLVICRILCWLLGWLTKTLQSLQSIVSQSLASFTLTWLIFPLFEALFLTDIVTLYVDVTSRFFCKTDRDEDYYRFTTIDYYQLLSITITTIDLLLSNLLSARHFLASFLNITFKIWPIDSNVCALKSDLYLICFLFWILCFLAFLGMHLRTVRTK